jgi:CelD/BcsL family acetyltransferase involved in cellulose biosynthesis
LCILVLREVPDDPLLREQWDGLVQHMEEPEVFYTYEWAISVQHAYGSSLRPLLLLGYDQQSLIGVAALAVKPNGEVAFLSETTADYCDFLSSPGWRRQWCDAIFSELRGLHFGPLSLANIPADSVTASVLCEAARKHGYLSFIRPTYRCARIVLGADEVRASLQRRTTGKKAFRRNLRLLDRKGAVVFFTNVADEDLDQVVSDFCLAHVTRFFAGGRLSNMIQPERRAFLQALAHQLSKQGWLSINRLFVGDRCVAWNYGFQFGRSWFWYQPTFDTNYERFSPGLALLGKVIEAACDNPRVGVVDLGLGAEDYKEKLANEGRQILHITVSASPIPHANAILRHRIADLIKTRPKVECRVRAAVNRLTRLQSFLREKSLRPAIQFLAGRVRDRMMGEKEVHFFQWGGYIVGAQDDGFVIRELDLNLLGLAAIEYFDDRGTLDYLARSAQRLRTGSSRGFALVASSGIPVHFCWVSEFEGFEIRELKQQLKASSPQAVLIFDCCNPEATRGHNYFATGIAGVASRLRSAGEVPWIFEAARNRASVHDIMKAGFIHKFTMRCRHLLGLTQTVETAQQPVVSFATMSTGLRDYAHFEN